MEIVVFIFQIIVAPTNVNNYEVVKPEHENGKENNEHTFFSCNDTMF